MNALRPAMRRTRPGGRRGGSAIEAAFVLPLVILFLLAIFEFGRYVMTIQVLTNAAREGAHYALAHTEPVIIQGVTYGNTDADVMQVVDDFSGGQQLHGQTIQIFASDSFGNNVGLWTDAGAGEPICVRISGNFDFIVPQLLSLPSSVPIVAQSVMRSEGN